MLLILSALVTGPGVQPSDSCSSFCITSGGRPYFGRNFDYAVKGGLIFVNKHNVAKTAATFEQPARWVSKHGSVTFNLYGCELPMGGMNEAGLVVAVLWLDGSQYPAADSLPAVNDLQWVQYQLDNCATIKEVVATQAKIRVSGYGGSQIHYLLADSRGACAAVEFLGGQMVIHYGSDLPVPVLTNTTYSSSLDLHRRFDGDTTSEAYSTEANSRGRFMKVARAIERFGESTGEDVVGYAFGILKEVGFGSTQWRIVYDIENRRIHFTTMDNSQIRSIELARLDFSCDRPVLIHDLAAAAAGDVTGLFEAYTYEKNRDLIRKSFLETDFLKDTPESLLEMLARYPESFSCQE